MSKTFKPDVLVVGAGIAGVALAVGLKDKGYRVILVERDSETRERFKGEYLQPCSVQTLQALGLAATLDSSETVKVTELRFRDLAPNDRDILSDITIRYPQGSYACALPHKTLVESLRAAARARLGQNFYEGATLEPTNADSWDFTTRPAFRLRTREGEVVTLRPSWVMGADGRQSSVRRWLGGPQAEANGASTYGGPEEFIVGAEFLEGAINPTRYEVIRTYNRGTLSLFELGNGKQRLYWNTPAGSGANKKSWEGQLPDLVKRVSGVAQLSTCEVKHVSGAPANTAWYGPTSKGRILLVGDAMAVTTPFGGQGMSQALYHVEQILRLIDQDDGSRSATRKIAKEYASYAKSKYRHINLLNFGLYYLFFAQASPFRASTRHILTHWKSNPEFMERVGRLFGGIDQDTPGIVELARLWGMIGSPRQSLKVIQELGQLGFGKNEL